jgi:hypothetical protein
MTGKRLSSQKRAALWRAYKQRQTANYVATHCKVSPHTAEKYIKSLNFKDRYEKLLQKANEFVDESQAQSLANTLKPLANIRALLIKQLLALLKEGELDSSISDVDRIIRLERYLRGEPDSRTEDIGSWRWLEEENLGE